MSELRLDLCEGNAQGDGAVSKQALDCLPRAYFL